MLGLWVQVPPGLQIQNKCPGSSAALEHDSSKIGVAGWSPARGTMWNIIGNIKRNDGYIYAKVPEHPNATTNGYVLMHRIVMENYIGRLLTDNEVVHHIDEDKSNNDITNLQLMVIEEHAKLHASKRTRKIVLLKCPQCDKEFQIYKNESFLQKKNKYQCTCCSNECRGKFYKQIQIHGVTPEIQSKIDSCFIREFENRTRDT